VTDAAAQFVQASTPEQVRPPLVEELPASGSSRRAG
jgi:hypothetical protein